MSYPFRRLCHRTTPGGKKFDLLANHGVYSFAGSPHLYLQKQKNFLSRLCRKSEKKDLKQLLKLGIDNDSFLEFLGKRFNQMQRVLQREFDRAYSQLKVPGVTSMNPTLKKRFKRIQTMLIKSN